jgi:hypothetical protein
MLQLVPIGALPVEQTPRVDFNALLNTNGRRHNLVADLRRRRTLGHCKIGRREHHQYGNNDQRSQRHYCLA